LLRRHGSFS
jgi:hypothetical protein